MNVRRLMLAAVMVVGATVGTGVGTASAASYDAPRPDGDTVGTASYGAPRLDIDVLKRSTQKKDLLTPWEKFCLFNAKPGEDTARCLAGLP